MTQKVIRVGTSAAIIIPKRTMLDRGIHIGDQVEVKVTPVKKLSPQDTKIAKLTLNFIERYRFDLEALANK